MEYPFNLPFSIPSEYKNRTSRTIRGFCGLSGTISIPVVIFSVQIFIQEVYRAIYNPERPVDYPEVLEFSFELFTILAMIAGTSVGIVYFLRILYQIKSFIETTWTRYTPPFTRIEEQTESEDRYYTEDELFEKAEREAKRFLVIFTPLFLLLIVIAIGSEYVFTELGNVIPESTESSGFWELAKQITRIIFLLPFVGDLAQFVQLLPGGTPLGKIILNGYALVLAFSIRNLMYIFEQPRIILEGIKNEIISRYTIYLALILIGVPVISLGVLVILAAP